MHALPLQLIALGCDVLSKGIVLFSQPFHVSSEDDILLSRHARLGQGVAESFASDLQLIRLGFKLSLGGS